ncbi:PorP/SprF family type IX secretion system membrane protein [Mariniflexile sp. AS56]|uniref:PorP/SprF family type IX secretion system membrane protein n=1 Tax=Mariniflexile sp. AS56 TaxID=3063957 RepID=UPI0026EBA720|nr:PorP/SprF family type IX secretion system membrane protein [Mariniflexile sp. AS56]MDO7171136.1 PorP/SprF family type IX secretion system membrane protein [Mariniflexile sp. AS56]
MNKYLLHIIIFFCFAQMLHSQEDGVVALSIPVRNSLKFNKYVINPTFSFVREQNKYLSFSNKREWAQFENAPQTYLFGYSGRLSENTGMGIGLFQQNYGVLTTFGGVLNYAYNVVLDRDSNLTFGLNLGFYKSGINEANVVTNFQDPSLQNIPSHMVATINPGINYGTTFFDFGVSLNNLVSYNFNTSQIIEENPEQSVQAHIMYTGFVDSRGFLDRSKFSGLLRSEFKKDQTVLSGIMMFTTTKGIWGQTGYNTLYGLSAGIGLNITKQIAIEYNYEKEMGDMAAFGNSHEVTVAYKFNKRQRYNYSDDEDEGALISPTNKSRKSTSKPKKATTTEKVDRAAIAEAKAQARAEALAKIEAKKEARLKTIEEAKAKQAAIIEATAEENAKVELEEETKAKEAEATRVRLAEEARVQEIEAARVKLAAEVKAQADEVARIKLAEDAEAKEAEATRVRLAEEARVQEIEAARVKLAAETKAQADEVARIKLEEETKAKEAEATRVRLAEEARVREVEAARVKLAAETKAQADEVARIKLEEETKAKEAEATRVSLAEEARVREVEAAQADEVARIKLEEETKAKEAEATRVRLAEEARVQEIEAARVKLAAEVKAQADEVARIKLEEETKAKEAEATRVRLAEEARVQEIEAARVKLAAETKAQADEVARIKLAEETKAKEAEATRVRLAEEARVQEVEAARVKLAAETKAQADEVARIKLAEETKAKEAEATRVRLAEEARVREVEAARVKLAEEAKAQADEVARIKLEEETKAKAAEATRVRLAEEARIKEIEANRANEVPKDATTISMETITKSATDSKAIQEDLIIKLNETVANREKDLKDLKEENDLSEQGIYSAPKPFKSVSAENAALESLKVQIDEVITSQDLKIKELEALYNERLKKVPNTEDAVNMIYLNEILILKEAQAKAKRSKATLVSELESIKIATEIERKRRIKRAAYDNEDDTYNKDRASLNRIKQTTEVSAVPLKESDFDFGEAQGDNIKIMKDVKNIESGYYLVIAVHNDVAKRDAFLTKAVASGQQNINFFYDVATSSYYIYYEKFDGLESARNAMQSKGSTPYNGNMSMVKIEN